MPNYSDIAKTTGIPKLKQETSVNYSLGFAWQATPDFTVTVDGYDIKIKNRIVISGLYNQGDVTLGTPLNDLLLKQGISAAQFFANAVNTTNTGVDIVLDYKKRWDKSHFYALLAGNIQHLSINKINIPWTFKGSAGVDNLFNVHPSTNVIKDSVNPNSSSSFGDSESGGPFEAVQMGFNGMRIFTKLAFRF